MSWILKGLKGPLLSEIEKVIKPVEAAGQHLQDILKLATTALSLAKALYLAAADPAKALLAAVVTQVQKVVDDFFATGGYLLVVDPVEVQKGKLSIDKARLRFRDLEKITWDDAKAVYDEKKQNYEFDNFGIPLMTPGTCISMMTQSFDNQNDPGRPQFSDEAEVVAIGIMVTAPDLHGFIPLLTALGQVLDMTFIDRYLKYVKQKALPPESKPKKSKAPFWRSKRLDAIGVLHDQHVQINQILEQLKGYTQMADDPIIDTIDIIAAKTKTLLDAVKKFNDLVKKVEGAIAGSGIYVTVIKGVGGNKLIKTQLQDAKLSKLTQNGYTYGILLVGGGPSLLPFQTLATLLGG